MELIAQRVNVIVFESMEHYLKAKQEKEAEFKAKEAVFEDNEVLLHISHKVTHLFRSKVTSLFQLPFEV